MDNKKSPQIRLKIMRCFFVFIFLMGGMVLRLPNAEAVEGFGTLNATIKVSITIVKMPCKVAGNGPGGVIDVNFGNEILTTRIDGSYHPIPINYTLTCDSGIDNTNMRVQIVGDGSYFDSSVLKTEQADLGIAIMNNGNKLAINNWLNFSYPNKPALTAVLVKAVGATLSGGDFSAAATMKIEYQ